jgi:diguanylate cyclase (GGDEF)-like protein
MDTYQERVGRIERAEAATDTFSPMAEASERRDPDPFVSRPTDPSDAADPTRTTDTDDAIPIITGPVASPTGWSDPKTGTDGPRYWDRLIISETARVGRYKRPVTVVLVEIAGLNAIGRLWGPRVAEHTLAAAARTLSKEIRTSDHIARIEPLRFGVLLTETSEIAAINFVERARAACERDLQLGSEVVQVAFGWASPPNGGDLADALALAARRLEAELADL